jgi:GH15 family glucan-1,4-alpha-glucosidase
MGPSWVHSFPNTMRKEGTTRRTNLNETTVESLDLWTSWHSEAEHLGRREGLHRELARLGPMLCQSALLCVQHEEDGANACTCADESIWKQLFPETAARFNERP